MDIPMTIDIMAYLIFNLWKRGNLILTLFVRGGMHDLSLLNEEEKKTL